MQSTKCCAPPSRKSSRSTLVITTYCNFIAAMVLARFSGSCTSGACGLPCATSQNGQRRVHTSPKIMKVAVPCEKHSPIFGQDASSHTVCNLCSRRICLISKKRGLFGDLARIQLGLRNSASGTILIGMRSVFALPFCFASVLMVLLHTELGFG